MMSNLFRPSCRGMPERKVRRSLPENFTLVLHGSVSRARTRIQVDQGSNFMHVMREIVTGAEFPLDVFKSYGITIFVEEDTDQGAEA